MDLASFLERTVLTLAGVEITVQQVAVALLVLLALGAVLLRLRRSAMERLESIDPEVRRTLGTLVEMLAALVVAVGVGVILDAWGLVDMAAVLGRAHAALNFELAHVAGTAVTPISVLTFLVLLGIAFQISRMVQLGLGRAARARGMTDEGSIGIAQRLAHYGVVTVGVAIALNVVGIEISGLFAAGAVFAVGIGFAMQTIAQNFVSGLILLVERTIKPGDIVEVEGQTLRVREMGIRSTVARTRDDEDIIIPNSTLVQGAVKNFTMSDTIVRVRAPVGVHYDSDLHKTFAVLQATAEAFPRRAAHREPVVLLTAFGSSSVDFEVSVWTNDPWHQPRIRSALMLAVWDALKEADIVIAYPQVDVHLDPPVEQALTVLGRR